MGAGFPSARDCARSCRSLVRSRLHCSAHDRAADRGRDSRCLVRGTSRMVSPARGNPAAMAHAAIGRSRAGGDHDFRILEARADGAFCGPVRKDSRRAPGRRGEHRRAGRSKRGADHDFERPQSALCRFDLQSPSRDRLDPRVCADRPGASRGGPGHRRGQSQLSARGPLRNDRARRAAGAGPLARVRERRATARAVRPRASICVPVRGRGTGASTSWNLELHPDSQMPRTRRMLSGMSGTPSTFFAVP